MGQLHPVNQTLLVVLDNQIARTAAAFEGLSEGALDAAPGGDCHSIRQIAQHLLDLRKFQLTLLGAPLAAQVPAAAAGSLAQVLDVLGAGAALVRRAVEEHNPDDWFAVPPTPRPGPWGGEATLARFARPLNDFTNHLGAVRALRRIAGHPAARTQ
jgi:hypothetical protein